MNKKLLILPPSASEEEVKTSVKDFFKKISEDTEIDPPADDLWI